MRVWNIQKTNFKISDFLGFSHSKALELNPPFQRRPVWPTKAKSYLIDTIVKGLPVPVIFLRERTDLNTLKTIREVVDGQQRLRTILSYIAPDSLPDFDEDRDYFQVLRTHNSEIAKMDFGDIPTEYRQRILQYEFSVHVLPSDTDDADVLKIFARMNSTGTKLNNQELRNAEFFGEFKETAYQLALEQLDRWRSWRIFRDDQIARMAEVELTSELLIYLAEGIQQKTQASIDSFYRANDDEFKNGTKITTRFQKLFDLLDDILGADIANTVFHRPPLFYSLFACVDQVYPVKRSPKEITHSEFRNRIKNASGRIEQKKVDDQVIEATQRRLSHRGSREAILKFLLNSIGD